MSGEEYAAVAKLEEIGDGGLHAFLGDEEILLVRNGKKVYAIGYLCSHMEQGLEGGGVEEGSWVCPHHGARFDLETGKALSMPAVDPIPTYEVKVENDTVYVKEPEE